MNRRQFLRKGGVFASGAVLLASSSAYAQGHQHHGSEQPVPANAPKGPESAAEGSRGLGLWKDASSASPATQTPIKPQHGQRYTPVITPNGATLPWKMVNGVKEFRLVAEPVVREFAPGMVAHCWGYNGMTPGPTIEVVEGDRLRIYVTNKLPEHTSIHWHGQRLPNGMDGVGGVTQPHIDPGKTFAYEFTVRRSGTFMYHPHSDEMVQMAMGMMGMFVSHPKNPKEYPIDRDFCFLLQSWKIDPGTYTPNTAEMLDFNLWSINSRTFPGIDSMVVRKGDRVRIRIGNLTMTSHPMHLHGHEFKVTCTDGGWVPPSAQWPEVTTDVPVGAIRAVEFVADEEGDWAFHCHKSHHTMGPMSHTIPNMMGVDQSTSAKKISDLFPGYMYMPMGSEGMAEMSDMVAMGMALPENTLPMMTGEGQYGPIEMGGMFTTLKVRPDTPPASRQLLVSDPGWYQHPKGTVAYEVS
jgi:FtsP/CotA-like multicopper oxidase with cupredoxin domain